MGFRDVRCLLIDALESGRYQHEFRADMESKNLLAVGEVSPEFVVRLLQRCPGKRYRASPYHYDRRILCHECNAWSDLPSEQIRKLKCRALMLAIHPDEEVVQRHLGRQPCFEAL